MPQQVPPATIKALRVVGVALLLAAPALFGPGSTPPARAAHPEVTLEDALRVIEDHGLDCVDVTGGAESTIDWWCYLNMDCGFSGDSFSCGYDPEVPHFQALISLPSDDALVRGASISAEFGQANSSAGPPADAQAFFTDLIELACPLALPAAAAWFDAPVEGAGYPGGEGCDAYLSLEVSSDGASVEYELDFGLSHSWSAEPSAPEGTPEPTGTGEVNEADGCFEDGVSDAWHNIVIGPNGAVETADEESRLTAAEALEGLELDGSQDESRNALVEALRADPMDADAARALGLAAARFEGSGVQCNKDSTAGQDDPPPAAPAEPGLIPGGAGDEQPFAASVPAPAEVSLDPIILLQSAALAALLVLLMPFPSQLFNSTLETHEDDVRRWLRLDRIGSVVGGIGAFWASWPGVALFTLLAAVLYGFLDPGFGLHLGSLATFLGMLAGIVLVTVAFAVPVIWAHRRHGDRPSLKVVPVSLLIGVACVLLSRLTNFQPGYLYGLLIGLAFARELSAAEEGRATAIGAALMLAVAFGAWLGLGALPQGEAFGLVVARTALAALMVAGLEGVVFGLLPMRFLPGEPLYAWNRMLWGVLLAIGAFAFFHILINPASGYLSDSSRTPLFTVLALLLGFSAVSVAFWAWFRFRGDTPADEQATA